MNDTPFTPNEWSPGAAAAAMCDLERGLKGTVTREPAELARAGRDFGGLVERTPALVVAPRGDDDVLLALEVARHHRLSIATRGAGHGQSGQGLAAGGIALELSRFAGPPRLLLDQGEAWIEGGGRWRELLDACFQAGWFPVAPTHFTDATAAGTLSVAGVGAESWRVGAQINNVRELEVATLDGRKIRCSPSSERELFDAVRGGLGQYAVILRARYPLRRVLPELRCHLLTYRDAAALIDDVERVAQLQLCSYLTAFVAHPPGRGEAVFTLVLGEETADLRAQPGGRWETSEQARGRGGGGVPRAERTRQYVSTRGDRRRRDRAAQPFPSALRDALSALRPVERTSLEPTPLWSADACPRHPFFRGYTREDAARAEVSVHPWVEHVFDRAGGIRALERLARAPPMELELGNNALIVVAQVGTPAPLFAGPSSEALWWGVGAMPRVSAGRQAPLLEKMRELSRLGCADGGKRYLSGWVEMPREADWAAHHRAHWSWMKSMKERLDPRALLNPGFVVWSESLKVREGQ